MAFGHVEANRAESRRPGAQPSETSLFHPWRHL